MQQPSNTEPGPKDLAARLPIGEFARLAGTTARAVRHYHSIGLLPEPERDTSGYRRYGAADLVALVRIVRLRAVGMPTAVIIERMRPENDEASLREALVELGHDIQAEIAGLVATRDRVLALAASATFEQPVVAVTNALRGHGLLGDDDELETAEEWLVTLLDALAPSGLSSALARADGLLDDPGNNDRLASLFDDFRALNDSSSDADVTQLARDIAASIPRRARRRTAAPVDLAVLDSLLADQLSPAQLRLVHHLDLRLSGRRHGARS